MEQWIDRSAVMLVSYLVAFVVEGELRVGALKTEGRVGSERRGGKREESGRKECEKGL